VLLGALTSGCSLFLVRPPAARTEPEQIEQPCTESYAPPVTDLVLGSALLTTGVYLIARPNGTSADEGDSNPPAAKFYLTVLGLAAVLPVPWRWSPAIGASVGFTIVPSFVTANAPAERGELSCAAPISNSPAPEGRR
jgi:hypothetical protein